MRTYSSALAMVVLAGVAGPALGQAHEDEDDVMPPAPARRPVYSRTGGWTDGFTGVQVNTGPNGQNIVGDAANEPSLAVDPTAPNRITIGWRQFDSISSNFRQAGNAWSNDGGRTWHNSGVLEPGVFRSDPVVRSNVSGRILYNSLTTATGNYTCQDFATNNGGQSFGAGVEAFGGDKLWAAFDRTGLASNGFYYAAWDTATAYNGTFTRSTDGGLTFMSPIPMPTQPNWGTLAVGPGGELYICGNANGNLNQFTLIKSTDASNPAVTPTFPLTRTVNMGGPMVYNTANTPNPGGLLGQAWVRVDSSTGPTRGNVYMLCSVNPAGADPLDVNIVRSTDGGSTWGTPVKVNDEPSGANAWQWFGAMDVARNGRIDAVWMDTKDTGVFSRSVLHYSYSTNAGATWAPSASIGPSFDSTIGWPQQNKIGDYLDIESDLVGASVAFSATYNGEQDVYFVRINDRDCNGNGVPDSVDLANGTLHDCNGNGIPDECERAAGVPVLCACYPNCDGSSTAPVLNVLDFSCFLNRFAAGDPWANCDGSTTPPTLNVLDFACFLNAFAAGCS